MKSVSITNEKATSTFHVPVQTPAFPCSQRSQGAVVVALFSLARILGEWSTIHSMPVHFFLEVEISLRTQTPLFMLGSLHSGSANWDDSGGMFPDKLCVSLFPDRFPHYARTVTVAQSAHSDFVGSRVYACLGIFYVPLSNTWAERMPNKSQHTKLTLKKKILQLLLSGFELATFHSWLRFSYQQASLAAMC